MTLLSDQVRSKLHELHCLVVVPTYNNERTLEKVLNDLIPYAPEILVVNDGSTDSTPLLLQKFQTLRQISYSPNKGKGHAIKTALKYAHEQGFRYMITMDSDGQHFPDDLLPFTEMLAEHPDSLLVGSRNLHQENMPKKNTFGNKFSNFWFHLFTGQRLPDTQSGYRCYPVHKMGRMKLFTNRYELEVEILVRSAWKGIPVHPVPIKVYYAEGNERVSHFRPGKDFTRISLLNTVLFFPALLWHRPKRLIKSMTRENFKAFFHKHFMDPSESPLRKSIAVAFGVFMGIIPIWGYQFVSALLLAHVLKLNKVIVGVAANISIPPMIPLLLYGSLKTGQLVLGKNLGDDLFSGRISFDTIRLHLFEYIVGSLVFAVILSLLLGGLTFLLIKLRTNKPKQEIN